MQVASQVQIQREETALQQQLAVCTIIDIIPNSVVLVVLSS